MPCLLVVEKGTSILRASETIGRFGWGLSADILSAKEGRAIVWTKQKKMMLGDIVSGSMMIYWLTTVL